MFYLEYEKYKKKIARVQESYEALLSERDNAIARKELDQIERIERSIVALRQSLTDRRKVLEGKKEDMLTSRAVEDIVYRMRYIERYKVSKIARAVHYSETQVYRILGKIEEHIETVRNS